MFQNIKTLCTLLLIVLLMALVAYVVVPAPPAQALTDWPLPEDGGFYEGSVPTTARASLSNSILLLVTAQVDTNGSVDTTDTTARYIGDTLLGTVLTQAWRAVSADTNGWKLITY